MLTSKDFCVFLYNLLLRRHCTGALTFSLLATVFLGLYALNTLQFDPDSSPTLSNAPSTSHGRMKFAYVFYATSSEYTCYALINAHRLIYDLLSDPKIDIVILTTSESRIERFCPDEHCDFPTGRVKIRRVAKEMEDVGPKLTDNAYYMDSYVRLEAFKLYDKYDRIIIIDADGLLLRNVDHIFRLNLDKFHVAASLAHYISHQWLSSVFLIIKPSRHLYQQLISYLTPDGMRLISAESDGSSFDMDILNHVLERGNLTQRLSKYYALLDSYFYEEETMNLRRMDELKETYYVHFTMKKPLMHTDTRAWPLETNAANQTASWTPTSLSTPPHFLHIVYNPFWKAFDQHCRVMVQSVPPVPNDANEFGQVYPDPQSMWEYINMTSWLIIVNL